MKKKDNNFELMNNNLPVECKDPEIMEEDFKLVDVDKSIHEQKFQTKPTTFLKDSLKRFRKNKSSVVAAYILGILILFAIIVPFASPYDVSRAASDTAFYNLQPKLFNSANGFWDGTVKENHIPIDPNTGYPDPENYYSSGISNMSYENESYTTTASKFGKQGYVEVGYYTAYSVNEAVIESVNSSALDVKKTSGGVEKFVLDLNEVTLTLKKFETVNEDKIKAYAELYDAPTLPKDIIPSGFALGDVELNFLYEESGIQKTICLSEGKQIYSIGTELDDYKGDDPEINLNSIIIAESGGETEFKNFAFQIKVKTHAMETGDHVALIKNFVIEPSGMIDDQIEAYFKSSEVLGTTIPGISFEDASEMMTRTKQIKSGLSTYTNNGYWDIADLTRFTKALYLSRCTFGSFNYDPYVANFGPRIMSLSKVKLDNYMKNKWIYYDYEIDDTGETPKILEGSWEFYILDKNACPINREVLEEDVLQVKYSDPDQDYVFDVAADVTYYKYLGYDKMPSFLFGTDQTGRDMFKYVFEGLRNSLLLGVLTFIICFIFGLVWGAISGYFGGAVDLIMERITDILSGIPWIVVMTLVILKTNESSFWTLALALCLTGWIGTAALTRTQFYRFRGREYVLASRTLGASHGRLIAKHILPNAMGTIITSTVLMIPAIIFEEATISYLGLGFKNLSSLGVILSNNQSELLTHPYQLIFPSIVIALLMISFNLFGNGLRDAINPSLKGEDE